MSEKGQNEDFLLIENSSSNISYEKDNDGNVYLEGVFTQFDVKNNNNRIYEANEVLPHIEELKSRIKSRPLLGAMDHPQYFDIKYEDASHIIESLNYDKENNQIVGKIRLLSTPKGEIAKKLVLNDKIDLNISSRAAGTVDKNNKVKIKKFFTYDLVADPGFENASLKKINESFGYSNSDSFAIYEINNKNTDTEMNSNYITQDSFDKYTQHLKEHITNLTNEIETLKENKNTVTDKNGSVSQRLEKLVEYCENIAENVDNVIKHNDYLANKIEESIKYSEYIGENVSNNAELTDNIIKYNDYLSKKLNESISYNEHIAEKTNTLINYTSYLKENLENNINYSKYLGENLDNNIKYSEYLAENERNIISYAEATSKLLDENLQYQEQLVESLNKRLNGSSNENQSLTESNHNETQESTYLDRDGIENSLNRLIESSQKTVQNRNRFLDFMPKYMKQNYDSLTESVKKDIRDFMNESDINSTKDVEDVWESYFSKDDAGLDYMEEMPSKYKKLWNNLTESEQNVVKAQANFYSLNTIPKIKNFWDTRDFVLNNNVPINESIKTSKDLRNVAYDNPSGLLGNNFKNSLMEELKNRNRR